MNRRPPTSSDDGRHIRGEDRRRLIADAAMRAIRRYGVDGVTHRRVADIAGVSPGSTTYHFADLDALLAAGVEAASAQNIELFDRWIAETDTQTDAASRLVSLVTMMVDDERERFLSDYEVYVAAIRRPHLQPFARAWDAACVERITQIVADPLTARLIVFALDGVLIDAALSDEPVSEETKWGIVRRLLRMGTRDE